MYNTRFRDALSVRQAVRLALAVPCVFLSTLSFSQDQEQSAENEAGMQEVVVLGRGESRQVQQVTQQQIDQLPPGTSPLKAIEKLPGVNFQSADPFGAYEWSTRVTIRGFNQNRIGFTLDGVPLGDMTYGNHNGLHISRAVPSEQVSRVVLSQGTGGLDTASASNLGGTVQFFSDDPAEQFGARLQQMLGSDSARRTYARLDSGELGARTRFTLSVVDSDTDKWKGGGDQQVRNYNFKLLQPVGKATLTAFYNYSDRVEFDYQDLSVDIVNRRGREWDNFFPDWNAAVAAANACNASGQNDAIACDDAYWNASGLRKDHLGYIAADVPFSDNLQWKANVYLHQDEGQGLWGTPYTPTPGGAPLSIRTTEYDLERQGVVTSLTWRLGDHEINGGIWFESNDFIQARRFYGEPSAAAPSRSFADFQRDPLLTQWAYDFDTTTRVIHLQDTWSITDNIKLNAGFRSVWSENEATTIVGPEKTGTLETDEPFLPQVGVNWRLTDDLEMFASGSRNVRTFASSGTSGPFSTTAAGFAAIRDVIEPETATNIEAGLRMRTERFEGVVAVYHVDFEDRLVGITQGPGIVGNPSVLANVGGVTTRGIETAFTWRPVENLSWFNSISYNDSEYDDDYVTTNGAGVQTLVPVAGKQVVDTPKMLFKSELGYQSGPFFAHADVNYVDERYYTYLNQGSVDSYSVLNAGIGYRFTGLGFVDQLSLQADVTNLTDEEYFSTIDSNGFVNSDPNGTTQTLLLGAPRQYFISLKAQF
jgi:iron complex outermembrane receptor protein